MLEEPLLEMDDREEVEKWEHVKELRLWMKHALGLTVDIIANDLNKAFFVSVLLLPVVLCRVFRLCSYWFILFVGFEGGLSDEVWLYPCD